MIFFKVIRRVIAAILLIVIAVPLYALGVTWQAANNTLLAKVMSSLFRVLRN